LFDEIAPRFADRNGGYTRILRLAKPRLGDAGVRAILEFVGTHDRVIQRSEKPAFSDDEADTEMNDTAEGSSVESDDAAVGDAGTTSDEPSPDQPSGGEKETE